MLKISRTFYFSLTLLPPSLFIHSLSKLKSTSFPNPKRKIIQALITYVEIFSSMLSSTAVNFNAVLVLLKA